MNFSRGFYFTFAKMLHLIQLTGAGMEQADSRIKRLIYLVPLLFLPWQGGGTSALAKFVDYIILAIIAWLLINSNVVIPKIRRSGWIYLTLLGWSFASLIWSVNRYQSFVWTLGFGLVGVTFVILKMMLINEGMRNRMIALYLAIAGITALWGFGIYLIDPYERLTGPFYLANPCAAFLLPAVILALVWVIQRRHIRYVLLAGVLSGALILTDSRTTLLIGTLSILSLAIIFRKLALDNFKYLAGTLVVAFCIVVGLNSIRTYGLHYKGTLQPGVRFSELSEGKSTSGSDRIYYLQSTFAIWEKHPLLGTGAGTFPTVHPQFQKRVISASAHAHNFYAETLADLGLVGFALIILLGISVLSDIIGKNRNRISLVLNVILIAIGLHFAIDIETAFPAMTLSLAMLLALRYSYFSKDESATDGRVPLLLLAGVCVIAAVMFYSQVRAFSHHTLAKFYSNDSDIVLAESEEYQAIHTLFFDPDYLTQYGIYLYANTVVMNEKQREIALSKALTYARIAQKRDPFDSQHYQLEGRVLKAQKDSRRAELAFRKALSLDRYNHPDYANDLAVLLVSEGRSDDALVVATNMLEQYNQEVVLNRNSDRTLANNLANLYSLVGKVNLDKGNIDVAKIAVKHGLILNPQNIYCRALQNALKDK